jgi:hypothetical protein
VGATIAVDDSLFEASDNESSPSGSDDATFDPTSMRSSFSAAGKRPEHNKRSYGRVFNSRHVTTARLQNGERPRVPSPAYPRPGALEVDSETQIDPKIAAAALLDVDNGVCAADVDAEDPEDEAAEMDPTLAVGHMRYRRADGSQVTRGMGRMLQ